MADLSQLYHVAPNTAAFMTGGQQALDDETQTTKTQELRQLIQKYQLENQQSQVMNPLLAQHQQGANDAQAAQLPGLQATSQSLQQKASLGQATLPNQIAHDNATLAQGTQSAGLKSSQEMTKFFTDSAAELDNIPAPARMGYLAQKIRSANQNPNDPKIAGTIQALSQLSPDKLPDALRKMASTLNKQQPAYQQAMDVETTKAASAEKVGGGHDAARIQAANITAAALKDRAVTMANSKVKPDLTFEGTFAKLKEPRQKFAALLEQAAKVGVNTEEGQAYLVRAKALAPAANLQLQNQPKTGTPDVSGMGVPTNPASDLFGGVGGSDKPKTGTTKSGAKYTIID